MKPLLFLASALIALPAPAQQTLILKNREVSLSYPAESVVEAIRQATVAAQVAGRITEVRVDAGQKVKAGEVVMRIDAREAQENVAGARARLAQAEADFKRAKELSEKKFISGAALDKAEAELKAARATSGQAGAGLSYATVTAPISGVVAQRQVELGEMAAMGRPLVTVFDPRGLRVIASVPQYKLPELRHAAKARVEFAESGKWLDAARVEFMPALDARSHTVTARVYLPDNADGIVPGMAARVHFIGGRATKLTVPARAVIHRGEIHAVYVLDAQNTPHLRQVRLGEPVGDGELEVLAGLAAGDKVSLEPVKSGIALKQAAAR